MNHNANMPVERLAFLRAINANPRDRTLQLVFADWLADHEEPRWEAFWRGGRGGLVGLGSRGGRGSLDGLDGLGSRGGLGSLVGLGGLGSLGGRGGRGGRGSLVGLVGLVGRGSLVGLGSRGGRGSLVGLGSRGGRGGRGGRGSLVGLFSPEAPIVLIPGENAMIFIPHGYGAVVLVGRVKIETPMGWVVEPCREILDTHNGDCWVALAAGKNEKVRNETTYGPLVEGGFRVPVGAFSIPWQGELPH